MMESKTFCGSLRQKQVFKTAVLLLLFGSLVYISDNATTDFTPGGIKINSLIDKVFPRTTFFDPGTTNVSKSGTCDWVQEHRNRSLTLGRNSRIVYNRVPKCGSRTILALFKKLKKLNKFASKSSQVWRRFNLTTEDERTQAEKILQMGTPALFNRHMYFFSFQKYTEDVPFYINVVREPVSQYISQYYFYRTASVYKYRVFSKREREMSLDECVKMKHPSCEGSEQYMSFIIPFFCGSQPVCGVIGRSSLERAKSNIEKYYSVVGFMEDLPNTFRMLEYVFPQYFIGAEKEYVELVAKQDVKKRFSTAKRREPRAETLEVLRRKMRYETEFYEWVKERFYEGLKKIPPGK